MAPSMRRHQAARGAYAGFVALGHHPRAGADGALGHRSARSGRNRASDVLRLNLDETPLREPAVVALPDHGYHEVFGADCGI